MDEDGEGWKEEYLQWWFDFLNGRGGKGVTKDTLIMVRIFLINDHSPSPRSFYILMAHHKVFSLHPLDWCQILRLWRGRCATYSFFTLTYLICEPFSPRRLAIDHRRLCNLCEWATSGAWQSTKFWRKIIVLIFLLYICSAKHNMNSEQRINRMENLQTSSLTDILGGESVDSNENPPLSFENWTKSWEGEWFVIRTNYLLMSRETSYLCPGMWPWNVKTFFPSYQERQIFTNLLIIYQDI